ncbi:MAG: putative (di)nucleoside polyphosphate hydrolase [Paracoccaceae bacterium]|jgi:putative (di)nucleoside polyphosphate hydrolase
MGWHWPPQQVYDQMLDPVRLPYRPCVGIMLINQQGLIFVAQRLDGHVPAWQMPQGGIDAGEDPQAAALRELCEETSITPDSVMLLGQADNWVTYDLPPDLLGKVWKGKYRGQKQLWFLMRFEGQDRQINIETEHPEFSQWRWIAAPEMIASIVPFKRAVYEQVVAYFQKHLA